MGAVGEEREDVTSEANLETIVFILNLLAAIAVERVPPRPKDRGGSTSSDVSSNERWPRRTWLEYALVRGQALSALHILCKDSTFAVDVVCEDVVEG